MKNEVFKPVGQCIYCGSKSALTREHIVPFGLQGTWVLPKASCRKCAAVTGELERKILRGPLLSVRAATNIKTRRPAERPNTYPMRVVRQGREELRNVPIANHFTLLMLPLLPPAAYIDDRPYTHGIDIIGTETIQFGYEPAKLMSRLGAESISVTSTWQYVEFARMIGKIAYALAVADFGLSAIAEPYVLPAIMGKVDDIGRWIGSDNYVFEVEKQGALHACGTGIFDWRGERLVITKVKLFASAHPSGYEVIVGRTE